MRGKLLHRGVERVGEKRLGVALEGLIGDRGKVIAGREDRRLAGDEDAAGLDSAVKSRQGFGQGVEDLVVECVAALGIGDADADDRLGGRVEQEVAASFSSTPTPALRGRHLR